MFISSKGGKVINYNFRCYDEETHRMVYSRDPSTTFTVRPDGKINVKIHVDGKPDRFILNPTVSLCTGATDKNGKLIYEDDLVQYQNVGTSKIKVYVASGLDTLQHNDEIVVVGNTSTGN